MSLLENQVAILGSSLCLLQESLWAEMSHTLAVQRLRQPSSSHYSLSKFVREPCFRGGAEVG